jgi:hypothetical protein
MCVDALCMSTCVCSWPWILQSFLRNDTKREKYINWISSKINICTSKDTIKKVKTQSTEWLAHGERLKPAVGQQLIGVHPWPHKVDGPLTAWSFCSQRYVSRIPGEALRLHITSTWMSHSYSTTVIFGQRQATVPSQVQGEKTTPRCQYKEAWSVVAMVVFEGSHTLKNNWNLI